MSDDINRDGKPPEHLAVAVTENHLLAVPKRVVIIAAVMDTADERQAMIVNRIALEDLPVKRICRQESLEGLLYLVVAAFVRISDDTAREVLPVSRIADCDVCLAARRRRRDQFVCAGCQ